MAEQMRNYEDTRHGQSSSQIHRIILRAGWEGRVADHNIGSNEKPEGIDEGYHLALGVNTKLC